MEISELECHGLLFPPILCVDIYHFEIVCIKVVLLHQYWDVGLRYMFLNTLKQ